MRCPKCGSNKAPFLLWPAPNHIVAGFWARYVRNDLYPFPLARELHIGDALSGGRWDCIRRWL